MSDNRWVYWEPALANPNYELGRNFVSADLGGFPGAMSVQPGDTLWLTTYQNKELFLTGTMTVGDVLSDELKAQGIWKKNNQWDALSMPPPFPVPLRARPGHAFAYEQRAIVFAKTGTEEPYRMIPLRSVLDQVCFLSSRRPNLTLREGKIRNPTELVNPRKLTAETGLLFRSKWK